ncbi:MAG: hypothetical protein ACSHX4_07450 [Opitutaceae bacterium]
MAKEKIESYYFIFGQSFPRGELIKLGVIGLLILFALASGGYFIYKDWKEGQVNKIEQVESAIELEAKEAQSLSPLGLFYKRYLEQSQMSEVQSIRAVGRYQSGEHVMDLVFLAKRPSLYKQRISYQRHVIEVGSNGEDVWLRQTEPPLLDVSSESLQHFNESLALLESTIPCIAWLFEDGVAGEVLELRPDADWNGRPCSVIKNNGLIPGTAVYHYFDKETGFEHYRRAAIRVDERRFRDAELFFSEPLEDAYGLPSKVELLVDGRVFYKISFEKILVNQGLPGFLFEKGEEF